MQIDENEQLFASVIKDGMVFSVDLPERVKYQEVVTKAEEKPTEEKKSGCLIATAAYGSELAPQVQLLREVRDNVLFSTTSGTSFMTAFNSVYYAFSPTVADWERNNTVFKELVKTTITPMLSTLSILNYVDVDSEQEVLGYGIGIIMLNIGMYFVAPALVIIKLKQRLQN
ncbi:MAG: CFI-box-CTERM domain-containing protein [Candidatus Nitrosotenuis sp.]